MLSLDLLEVSMTRFHAAVAFADHKRPRQDVPDAALIAVKGWQIARQCLTHSLREIGRIRLPAPASEYLFISNFNDLLQAQAAVSAAYPDGCVYAAESILLGFSPGFKESHDTIRTLMRQRLSDTELCEALRQACEIRSWHPYFRAQ
jgi:hypothetical protein